MECELIQQAQNLEEGQFREFSYLKQNKLLVWTFFILLSENTQ